MGAEPETVGVGAVVGWLGREISGLRLRIHIEATVARSLQHWIPRLLFSIVILQFLHLILSCFSLDRSRGSGCFDINAGCFSLLTFLVR